MKKRVEKELKVAKRHLIEPGASITPEVVKIKYTFRNDYKPLPREDNDIIDMADALIMWAKVPTSMVLNKFPLEHDWSPYRWKKLAEKHEYFAEMLEIAKEMIAARVEEYSRSGDIDMAWVKEFLPKYSQEYKEQRIEMVTKVSDMLKGQAVFTPVYMDAIPNSNLVPERSKDQ